MVKPYNTEEERKIYSRGASEGMADLFKFELVVFAIWGISALYRSYNDKLDVNYAQPSKLEIMTKDLDGDGKIETIMKYDTNTYLLKLNLEGKLVMQEYEIIQSKTEIIYK